MRLVLASSSPRRRLFMEMLGMDFEVIPSDVDERAVKEEDHVKLAMRLARMKAEDVAGRLSKGEDALVIGADTLVSFQGRVIGKAGSVEEARETLKSYAGEEHEQITGVCIINTRTGKAFEGHDVSRVACRDMGKALEDYLSTGEPMDGAGCYTPRAHPFLFEHVDGSWTNIVGLPMGRFVVLLGEALRG